MVERVFDGTSGMSDLRASVACLFVEPDEEFAGECTLEHSSKIATQSVPDGL